MYKNITIISSIVLSSISLNAMSVDINNQKEYFKKFSSAMIDDEDSSINVNCSSCGIEYNHPNLDNLYNSYNKNTLVKFVKNGISMKISKNYFINNMKSSYLIEKSFPKEKLNSKTINNFDNSIFINGSYIKVSILESMLKKYYEKKNIKKNPKTKDFKITKISKNNIIKKQKLIKYNFAVGTYLDLKNSNRFISKSLSNKEIFKVKKYGKYFVVIKEVINEFSYSKNLRMIKSDFSDAYLISKTNIINVRKDIITDSIKKNKDVLEQPNYYNFVVATYLTEKYAKKYLRKNFDGYEHKVLRDNTYVMSIVLDKIVSSKEDQIKKIKEISKDAWYLKTSKIDK